MRHETLKKLSSSIQAFLENDPENPTLSGFLDEVALYTDLDSQEAGDNCVTLMTMHSAFGQGMVLSVRPMGGDALVEVAFDRVGTKRLMLKAAGAHLVKL